MQKAHAPLTIVNTFAPHGETEKANLIERRKHVGEVLGEIPPRRILIWRADVNGKLGKASCRQAHGQKIIWPYADAEKTEAGDGKARLQIRKQHNAIPTNTWTCPPVTKKSIYWKHSKKGNSQ